MFQGEMVSVVEEWALQEEDSRMSILQHTMPHQESLEPRYTPGPEAVEFRTTETRKVSPI